ncbi:MAG: hypothetical protein ABFS08_07890 [Pseudomonadota bacterium]
MFYKKSIINTNNGLVFILLVVLFSNCAAAQSGITVEYKKAVQRKVYIDKVVSTVEYKRLKPAVFLAEVPAGEDDFSSGIEKSLASYFSATWMWNAIENPERSKRATEMMGRQAKNVHEVAAALKKSLAKRKAKRGVYPRYYIDYVFRHNAFYVVVGTKTQESNGRSIEVSFQEWLVEEGGEWKFVDKYRDHKMKSLYDAIASRVDLVTGESFAANETRKVITPNDSVMKVTLPIK